MLFNQALLHMLLSIYNFHTYICIIFFYYFWYESRAEFVLSSGPTNSLPLINRVRTLRVPGFTLNMGSLQLKKVFSMNLVYVVFWLWLVHVENE